MVEQFIQRYASLEGFLYVISMVSLSLAPPPPPIKLIPSFRTGRSPRLVTLRFDNHQPKDAAILFNNSIGSAAKRTNVLFDNHVLPWNTPLSKVIEFIASLNKISDVDGIVVIKPLPEHLPISLITQVSGTFINDALINC